MNNNEFQTKISYLEKQTSKFGCLISLTTEQINKLKEQINNYKAINAYNYKDVLEIPDNIKKLKHILKLNNIDYKNISSSNNSKKINTLLNIELKTLILLEKELIDIINPKHLLEYETIKNNILKNEIINKEKLKSITTKNNKESINKIIDYKSKINIINKNTLERHIKHKQKNIILDIDNKINSICYKLDIETNNKTYKEKYFEILDKIKEQTKSYKELLEDNNTIYINLSNVENNLTREMKKNGAEVNLTFSEIKELSETDIDGLIEKITLYKKSKKQLTDESKAIFKK